MIYLLVLCYSLLLSTVIFDRPGHEEESDLGGRHDHEDHGEGRSQDAGLAPGMKSIGKP